MGLTPGMTYPRWRHDDAGNAVGFIDPSTGLDWVQHKTTVIARTDALSPTTGSTITLNTLVVDEEGAADTTNGVINIGADVDYIQIQASVRFNNGAPSLGVYRRLRVEMDSGTDAWAVYVPTAMDEVLYVAGSTADSVLKINTPKIPISALTAELTARPTKIRLLVEHDNGGALALGSLGNAGSYNAYLACRFFR